MTQPITAEAFHQRIWEILDPVLEHWASLPEQPEQYEAGTWGPQSGYDMVARDGFTWRRP